MEPSMREDLNDLAEAVMNNPLIGEKIFEQVDFNDKKNLRLINKVWRDCTLEEWRSNSAAIRMVSRSRTEKLYMRGRSYNQILECKPYATRYPFVETFERMMKGRQEAGDWPAPFCIQEKPFRQVILTDGIFCIPNCEERSVAFVDDHFKLFLDKFGSQLDYLRLEKCEITPEEMKWIVQKACPQLKTLSLELDTHKKLSLQPSVSSFQKVSPETLQVESRLTKLEIVRRPKWYEGDEEKSEINPEDIFRSVPNLKSLKYSERPKIPRFFHKEDRRHFRLHYGWCGFPITKGLCLPLANGKYLELEELDLYMYVSRYPGAMSSHEEEILGLSRYIELIQPSSFKKFRLELKFESLDFDPLLDQFFLAKGHLLTHLHIQMKRRDWKGDGPKLASHLTSYYLPNLTHLTVHINNYSHSFRRCGETIVNFSRMGSISPVIQALQAMPKLQVFRCVCPCLEFSKYPQNLQLSELKEFAFQCGDKLTVANLMMILGWMKGVKKLALILDEKTFPLVFELAPQLEQLILLGKDGGLTEIEKETGVMWMGPTERVRQAMEWNKKRSPIETRNPEMKGNDESEKEEDEGWTVVNHRQPKGKKEKPKQKETIFVYLPRRPRSTKVEPYGQLVDDFTVFCKLQEIGKTVRIFRTKQFREFCYGAWIKDDNEKVSVEDLELIEYKV